MKRCLVHSDIVTPPSLQVTDSGIAVEPTICRKCHSIRIQSCVYCLLAFESPLGHLEYLTNTDAVLGSSCVTEQCQEKYLCKFNKMQILGDSFHPD